MLVLGLAIAIGLINRSTKVVEVPRTIERVVLVPEKTDPMSHQGVVVETTPMPRRSDTPIQTQAPTSNNIASRDHSEQPKSQEQKRAVQPRTEPQSIATPAQPTNLIWNGDFSQGNVGFVSSVNYVSPDYNCLWHDGYTIAPVWNNPVLHRLITPGEYSAPEKQTGNEQVLYMNIDGTESKLIWAAEVACDPQTNYDLSFWTICLSGEPYVLEYQFVVNGEKGPVQSGGFGSFKKVTMRWNSGSNTMARVAIMRMPRAHYYGGVSAFANITMIRAD
ncbi:MAG: hypothetical protein KIT74_09090 [Fimbriimonadales bacterium]|nr:hypothetical protein [Fimbriimonadales bacterium]